MTHPIVKGLLFALIPLVYYLLDMLNYAQAGKSGLLGFFVLTTLFYWHSLYPKKKLIVYAIAFATTLIYGFMVFQAGLRDIFGVEQDSIIVLKLYLIPILQNPLNSCSNIAFNWLNTYPYLFFLL